MVTDVALIREAIVQALPFDVAEHGELLDAGALYVPPAHLKALRLECSLVVGARGVGKSFWTQALASADLRSMLGQSIRELDRTDVYTGFAEMGAIAHYPDAESFARLLAEGHSAFNVWRAVVLRWLAEESEDGVGIPRTRWADTVAWVRDHPEDVALLMQQASQRQVACNRWGLIVFDALDRISDDWGTLDNVVRDLLKVALWLKSYPRLQAKIFLREDQFHRPVTDFPDASKLLTTKADLTWATHDLHGLLWQRLINAPGLHGEHLRHQYQKVLGTLPILSVAVWQLPEAVKRDTPAQRALFEALAGPWMGRDKRRGVPYVWSVSHLADGRGQTSPRSFLAAIRHAAEDSQDRYPDHVVALHYESIKRGIQRASEIRVAEVAEDYPWVRLFLQKLHGFNVPCEFERILKKWDEVFPQGPAAASQQRLPPQHLERGWNGIRDDLNRLGVFDLKQDGRIDMPDLYRVGFGLGRNGGVKPKT